MLRLLAPALVLLLLAPTGVAPESPNPNRVANGGFETDADANAWPDAWTFDAARSGAACAPLWSTTAYAGNRSVAFEADAAMNCFYASDPFSAVAGVEYLASARTMGDENGGGVPALRLEFLDLVGLPVGQPCVGRWPYGGGWQEATMTCVAPLGTVGARVVLEGSFVNLADQVAVFDNVSVKAL